jgi:SNF2 family DNA or RNA helicase
MSTERNDCRTVYRVGDKILHREFGEGLVVEVRPRLAYDVLEVVFPDAMRRISSIHPLLAPMAAPPPPGTGREKRVEAGDEPVPLFTPRIEIERADDAAPLRQALRGPFDSSVDYLLHREADRLSVRRGFEKLLSLERVRDVERFGYQIRTCLSVLREMKGRALLADEVGLGKTIEACLILKEYVLRGLVRRALILVPASLTLQWQEELSTKFGMEASLYGRKDRWKGEDFVVCSLDTAKTVRNREAILRSHYDLVIVDEAHRLRNHQTLAWKFISALSARYVLLLTATPVQNDLRELYNLVTLLRPGTLGTYRAFRRNFMVRGDRRIPRNTDELRQLLSQVMIRNVRAKTSLPFPRRSVRTIPFDLSPGERELYDAVSGFIRGIVESRGRTERHWQFITLVLQKEIGSSPTAAARTLARIGADSRYGTARPELLRLARMAEAIDGSSKLEGLLALLRTTKEKVLLFTQFRSTLDYLAKELGARGYGTATFHGTLPLADKEEAIRLFREDRQILISTDAGGEGRNLQFARNVVNYDLPWNPMKVEQRIGRVHRLGQTQEVRIFNFAAENTVENYVLEILARKIGMFELVIGEMEMILGHFEEEHTFEHLVFQIWTSSPEQPELRRRFQDLGDRLLVAKRRYEEIQATDQEIFDAKK